MPIIDRAERVLARHRACREEMEAQEGFDDGDFLPDRSSSRRGGDAPGTTEGAFGHDGKGADGRRAHPRP